MKIVLEKLNLNYFKGIRNRSIEFKKDIVLIKGDNGTGKSTLFDAFTWLFFGKDSHGNSDNNFAIKTIDIEGTGEIISRVEHSVEAQLLINDEPTSVKRVLVEKWVKKSGATERTNEGNKTEYYFNDVPLKKKDFDAKISQIIPEDVFKRITDPYAFNNLHWEKQREMLIQLEGEVTNESVAKGNPAFEELMLQLKSKSLEEYKSQIKHSINKLKNDKAGIPQRIDEQLRQKPESKDFDAIQKDIEHNQELLTKVDDKIADVNKTANELHKKYEGFRSEKSKLRSANQDIEFDTKQEVQTQLSKIVDPTAAIKENLTEAESKVLKFTRGIEGLQSEIKTNEATLESVKQKRKAKGEEWDKENAKELEFKDGDFDCPTCGQPIKADDEEAQKEKMRADFIKDKKTALDAINKEGSALKEQQIQLEKAVADLQKRVTEGEEHLKKEQDRVASLKTELDAAKEQPIHKPDADEEVKKALAGNKTYQANLKRIEELDEALNNQKGVDTEKYKEERRDIQTKIDALKTQLADKAKIEAIDTRVAELEQEEKENAQELADTEREQDRIKEFETAKYSRVEDLVNTHFEHVKFKMFSELVDGTQIPACICTYKGVPFNDVNTAGKIKAGLDIINTLCKFYEVNAPIFIDGAESITEIPTTDSQQVQLIVKKKVIPFIVE